MRALLLSLLVAVSAPAFAFDAESAIEMYRDASAGCVDPTAEFAEEACAEQIYLAEDLANAGYCIKDNVWSRCE